MVNMVQKLWKENAPLMATSALMCVVFLVSVAGIFLDPRIIMGAPAWLKPAKFAISTAIYAATMAWLFQYIHVWPRFLRAAGWVTAVVFVVEVGIIDVQAARGTTSHFNATTPLNQVLFVIMGVSIGILWATSVGILTALFRQKFSDPVWGWSLRLGMLITVIGSAAGGAMIPPTPVQMTQIREHQMPSAVGAHTVGAPDGGPGLPGVGWSKDHGDLRAPHFLGMHGIQAIAFLGWLIGRRRGSVAMVATAAGSYFGLAAILMWQALRGQSIIGPDQTTLVALGIWLVATGLSLAWSEAGRS